MHRVKFSSFSWSVPSIESLLQQNLRKNNGEFEWKWVRSLQLFQINSLENHSFHCSFCAFHKDFDHALRQKEWIFKKNVKRAFGEREPNSNEVISIPLKQTDYLRYATRNDAKKRVWKIVSLSSSVNWNVRITWRMPIRTININTNRKHSFSMARSDGSSLIKYCLFGFLFYGRIQNVPIHVALLFFSSQIVSFRFKLRIFVNG